MTDIKVGADPEFFLQRGRHFVSAHELPFGTKFQPMQVRHGAIHIDGLAVECNVKPASTKTEFVENVGNLIVEMHSLLEAYMPGAKPVARPSVFFGEQKLSQLPGWALALGCDTDLNAYTGKPNRRPNPSVPFRTGAGHVHVSWTENESLTSKTFINLCCSLAKELDFTLGLPSLVWDTDSRRRRLYGRAGAFRPKPYGLEYRVLSNKWLTNPTLVGWVFERTVATVKNVLNAQHERFFDRYGRLAETYINDNNLEWTTTYRQLKNELIP